MTAWAVTWRRKPIASPFILDFDGDDVTEMVAEVAIRLGSTANVYDVKVVELMDAAMDPETKAAIQKRISQRRDHEWAIGVMT